MKSNNYPLGGLCLLLTLLVAARPASAIEIFGFKFLEPDAPETVELIDPFPYTTQLVLTEGNDAVMKAVEAASGLIRNNDRPASGRAGLLSTASGDYARILDALYGLGRFGPRVSITIDGREAADLPLGFRIAADPRVIITVATGPVYRFGTTSIAGAAPGFNARAQGFAPGERASSDVVRATARALVRQWQEQSHAMAAVTDTSVTADHAARRLDVRLVAEPGPPVRYGAVSISGTEAVDHAFLRYMADLPPGAPFHPDDIKAAQRRLVGLDTFRSVDVTPSETLAPDGTLPVDITVTSRERRRFGVGATLSSIDGLGLEGFWLHRNLFDRAERLRFDGSVNGIGRSLDPTDYDYAASVSFLKPGVITPETEMKLRFGASQEKRQNYNALTLETSAGLATTFSDTWSGESALVLERSRIDDSFGRRRFSIFSLENRLTYEGRDVPLDATEGYFLETRLVPFTIDKGASAAVKATMEGRAYRALDPDAKYVLAGRARIGTVEGIGAASAPPSLLFFSGGGGSVRGFEYLSNGVTVGGQTSGGRSLVELSGEVRADFDDSYGGVVFLDAGNVGAGSFPDLNSEWKVGGGVGIRFNTGLGPLRIDVARSLQWKRGDPQFALYIGLGQAF